MSIPGADLLLALRWESAHATHSDRLFVAAANPGADRFPGRLADALRGRGPGTVAEEAFAPGQLVPAYDEGKVLVIRPGQFRSRLAGGREVPPRAGRFYPCRLLQGVPGAGPRDLRPFRMLEVAPDAIRVDLNHPLARYPLRLEARLLPESGARAPSGARDIAELATSGGPGLQAEMQVGETDFRSGEPYARPDASPDADFYRAPRQVSHLDGTALAGLRSLYERFLQPGMDVLDLMASWDSHLPAAEGVRVTGLGLNREELERNPLLAERVVHDLNAEPRLPFPDGAFDLALCTVSVEYLTRPEEVLREVGRTLRPGAAFVATFSERWFPPKVVRIWTELHPFQRMGLVLDWLWRAGRFAGLASESLRGLPRPAGDRYAVTLLHSDPLYAAWGRRA